MVAPNTPWNVSFTIAESFTHATGHGISPEGKELLTRPHEAPRGLSPLTFPPLFCLLAPSPRGDSLLTAGHPWAPPPPPLQEQARPPHGRAQEAVKVATSRTHWEYSAAYSAAGGPGISPGAQNSSRGGGNPTFFPAIVPFWLWLLVLPSPHPLPSRAGGCCGCYPWGLYCRCLPSLFPLNLNRNRSSFFGKEHSLKTKEKQ